MVASALSLAYRHSFQSRCHLLLVGIGGIKGRERSCDQDSLRRCTLTLGYVPSKWRIHDYQVEPPVWDVCDDLGGGLLADAARAERGIAHVEQGHRGRRLEQLKRAYGDAAVFLSTVGERVQPCLAEPDVGLCAGQRRAGDVDGRRHHVAAVQHLLHHDGVKCGEVATGALVLRGDLLVHRRQQRAGAAREVADLELADGFGVGPVHVHLGHRESREQSRGRRERVERRQVLAVGYQPLEDASGQVVRLVRAGGGYVFDSVAQFREKLGGLSRRNLLDDVSGNGEDRPVVDLEYLSPGVEYVPLPVWRWTSRTTVTVA